MNNFVCVAASSAVQKRHRQQLVGLLARQRAQSPQHQQRADIGRHLGRHGRRAAQIRVPHHHPHSASGVFVSRPAAAADGASSGRCRHGHVQRVVACAIRAAPPEKPLGQQ